MVILEMVVDTIKDIVSLVSDIYTSLCVIMKMKLVIFNKPSKDGIIYISDKSISRYLGINIGTLVIVKSFDQDIPVIVLGELYDNLDVTTKNYIIEHQKEHIKLHLPAPDDFVIIDSIRELEADEGVAKKIGDIGVLSSLIVLKGMTNEEDLISDLEYRIEYFKNKLRQK